MYLKTKGTDNAKMLPLDQDAWMLFQFENLEMIRIHLDPGTSIENHVNEWRIVFYLLQGEGHLTVEGETKHLTAHQSIAVEAGKERFWSNTGKDELQLLVVKTRMDP